MFVDGVGDQATPESYLHFSSNGDPITPTGRNADSFCMVIITYFVIAFNKIETPSAMMRKG